MIALRINGDADALIALMCASAKPIIFRDKAIDLAAIFGISKALRLDHMIIDFSPAPPKIMCNRLEDFERSETSALVVPISASDSWSAPSATCIIFFRCGQPCTTKNSTALFVQAQARGNVFTPVFYIDIDPV